jgi:hypothetical protein
VGFVAAEGTYVNSVFGRVDAFFLGITADVPAVTNGLGGFWDDEVSIESSGIHRVVVFKCCEFALCKGVTPLSADEAGGGGGVAASAFAKWKVSIGWWGF